jgi:cell wall-associated NlpC family hydrolase
VGAHPVAVPSIARRCAAVAVTVLTAAGLLIVAGSAGAQPQPTISQVEARLKKLTLQEDVLIQRFDQANQNLASARQRLALVNREVARDQAAIQAERNQIAAMASTVYEDGSMTSVAALITSSSPQTLLSRSAILVHLSTANHQQLEQFIATDRQLLGAQQVAKRTEAAVAAITRQLASQKATLTKLINQQKSTLSRLTAQQRRQQLGGGGTTGGGGGNGGGGGGGGGGYHGPTSTQAEKAVSFAYAQLGCPYLFGGTSCHPGYDCSGLTQAAWAAAGVQIPRTSYEQATLPQVPLSQIQPGDILLFAGNSHAGLYVGGGMLIDAPQPGMSVEKVSLGNSWYGSNLDEAVRP